MKAIANRDLVFWSFNCLSAKGRKLRKHRKVQAGQDFEVVKFFTASGGVFSAGAKCVAVRGDNGSLMADFAECFDYECKQDTCPLDSGPLPCPDWSCPLRQEVVLKDIQEFLGPETFNRLRVAQKQKA